MKWSIVSVSARKTALPKRPIGSSSTSSVFVFVLDAGSCSERESEEGGETEREPSGFIFVCTMFVGCEEADVAFAEEVEEGWFPWRKDWRSAAIS